MGRKLKMGVIDLTMRCLSFVRPVSNNSLAGNQPVVRDSRGRGLGAEWSR